MAEGDKLDPTGQTQALAPELDVSELPTAYGVPPLNADGQQADEFRQSLVPGRKIGRFLLEAQLGEGGMGMVFLAHDPELNRKVALKVLRPGGAGTDGTQAQQRMLREAQAMAMLSHPNLVTIYEVGTYRKTVFLAMECVVGVTLDDWLEGDPPLEDVFEVLGQAGLALQAVHDAGLVHRDFKPGNVLVTEDHRAKVLDLGIARKSGASESGGEGGAVAADASDLVVEAAHGSDAFDANLTQAGAVIGTPAYMPPEQLMGGEVGPYSDQFSFGVVLFEALTGERPFEGKSYNQLLANILSGVRRPWTEDCEAPPRLREVVERALSPTPSDRYDTVGALLAACQDALGLRGQIRFLCRRWLDHERAAEYLLGAGALLDEGRALLRNNPEALSVDQQEFVRASARSVGRRRLQRRALVIGLGVVSGVMVLTALLLQRRSRQLEAAARAAVAAHMESVKSGVAGVFDTAEHKVKLLLAQRRVWLPPAARLFSVEERDADDLLPQVSALNDLFRPFIEESPSVSSLMVSRESGAEYLAFEDPDAENLKPAYRFYNRLVNRRHFSQDAFQVFSSKDWETPPRTSWLPVGGKDSRGQIWAGYAPASRIWFQNAAAHCCGNVTWTQPYLFFVTKDAGITASVAIQEGGQTYVLGVDFMLTDLSRVTTGLADENYWCTITDRQGRIVSLPRDPRFMEPQRVRAFFAEADLHRRQRASENRRPDVAAKLPAAGDLGIPALSAALRVADSIRRALEEQKKSDELGSYTWQSEKLSLGVSQVGAPEQGLFVTVVQKPRRAR